MKAGKDTPVPGHPLHSFRAWGITGAARHTGIGATGQLLLLEGGRKLSEQTRGMSGHHAALHQVQGAAVWER